MGRDPLSETRQVQRGAPGGSSLLMGAESGWQTGAERQVTFVHRQAVVKVVGAGVKGVRLHAASTDDTPGLVRLSLTHGAAKASRRVTDRAVTPARTTSTTPPSLLQPSSPAATVCFVGVVVVCIDWL